jgi:hypothetical protein
MLEFQDDNGDDWVASAREELTPRHHGRWYLVFQPLGANDSALAMPEVRWQTRASAQRTLRTMSLFELRRRLAVARARAAGTGEPGPATTAERSIRESPAAGTA